MIELYLFEQLLAFERCGTLSLASEELHISQPALSQSMKKLEEQVGVSLFERTKNRLVLNETGRLTVDCAKELLRKEEEIIERIRLFDRANRTICFGACAPVPVSDIVPLLTQLYNEMTVSSELKNTDEELWNGLDRGTYQMIVVHERVQREEGFFIYPYRQEHLCLLVPVNHPLAEYKEIHLADLADQNLLLYTHIGFWYELCKKELSTAHFLYMNERDAFEQVAGVGAFPSFTTDAFWENGREREAEKGKVVIPIVDEIVNVTYYFVCRMHEKQRFLPLIKRLEQFWH